MKDLDGKNVVVTGGSYGMGKEMARAFLKEGSNVFIIARNKEKLDAATEDIGKDARSGRRAIGFPCDVTDREGIAATIDRIAAEEGGIDVLVNNAGIVIPGYVEDLSIDDFETVLKTNYLGAVYTIKAALPYLLKNKKSAISITSSIVGIKGIFGYATYAPTKFALIGLAEVLRTELKDKGVQVSVLLPPDTDTPGFKDEKEVRPVETDVVGGTAGLMPPEVLAENFMKGFKKGKFLIICEFTGKLLCRLNGISRGFTDFYLDRLVAKGRKEKAKRH
jgi:3-dehydrosphinganine reductase